MTILAPTRPSRAFVSLIFMVILIASALAQSTGVRASGVHQKSKSSKKSAISAPANAPTATPEQSAPLPDVSKIRSAPLGDRLPGVPFNASGIVEIGDGRFLFCDNKEPGALFELRLDADGKAVGPVTRRPLTGIDPASIGDIEGLTTVRLRDETFVVATSSFNRLHTYEGKTMVAAEGFAGGLLRIREEPDGSLSVKNLPDFRAWLVSHFKELVESALKTPDEGGLNIEGLSWDPTRHALMFGVRTPLIDGAPIVLPVKLVGKSRTWDTTRFEALPAVRLKLDPAAAAQGIRSIEYDQTRKGFFFTVGKAVSGDKVPFYLYFWNGKDNSAPTRFVWVVFSKKFKVEGLTPATLGGRDAVVLLDDGGGYSVLWADDLRLQ